MSKSNKYLARLTNWLTVSCNVTLILTWVQWCWVLHGNWWKEDLNAEETPLIEADARERPVKTQQAGKMLSEYCGDLWIVDIDGRAVIACSSKSCV
jgi:hypothetical protein